MWIETEEGRLVNAEFVRVFFIAPLEDDTSGRKGPFLLRARNEWQDVVICEGSQRLCACVKDAVTHHIGQDSRWYYVSETIRRYVSETIRRFNENNHETGQCAEPDDAEGASADPEA